LSKASSFDVATKRSVLPKTKWLFKVKSNAVVNLNGAVNERHPAKRPFGTKAGSKFWVPLGLVARHNKLATNGLHGIRMQPKISSASGAKFDQIKCAGKYPVDVPSHIM
jgi:hypothetical protein